LEWDTEGVWKLLTERIIGKYSINHDKSGYVTEYEVHKRVEIDSQEVETSIDDGSYRDIGNSWFLVSTMLHQLHKLCCTK
jgi:hypothetical protein